MPQRGGRPAAKRNGLIVFAAAEGHGGALRNGLMGYTGGNEKWDWSSSLPLRDTGAAHAEKWATRGGVAH